MNTPRDTTLEYQLDDADVTAILSESPDATLVADYLGGILDPDQASAFRARLRTDATFREFAQPRLDAWYALTRVKPESTPDELHGAWIEFRRHAGLAVPEVAPPASGALDEVKREVIGGVRFLKLAATLLLIVGIPSAGWIGYQLFPTVRSQATYMHHATTGEQVVTVDVTSTVRLERGARFIWQDRPSGVSDRELILTEGAATFTLQRVLVGAYVVVTPAGRVRVTGTTFRVEVVSPMESVVRVDEGDVQLEAAGVLADSTTHVTLRAGQRGRLAWGQRPRREP